MANAQTLASKHQHKSVPRRYPITTKKSQGKDCIARSLCHRQSMSGAIKKKRLHQLREWGGGAGACQCGVQEEPYCQCKWFLVRFIRLPTDGFCPPQFLRILHLARHYVERASSRWALFIAILSRRFERMVAPVAWQTSSVETQLAASGSSFPAKGAGFRSFA